MFTRKTKIVCSIGPACDNDETIRKMIRAGMNIARFNFSHGSYEWHKTAMERVRRISEEIDIPVGILLDTKGPEIRTGLVENDGKIEIRAGEKIEHQEKILHAQAESFDIDFFFILLAEIIFCQNSKKKIVFSI